MRKLYNEFFYVPKYGKVREKVMLTRIAMTVAVVIICLAAMSFTAYAYFSHDVTSRTNVMKAATFEANIKITNSNNASVTATKVGNVQTVQLEAGKYTIELSTGNSTAHKGFCVITIGGKVYYTDQLGVDAEKNLTDAKVKFQLQVSAPTKIEVLSHWGTSAYYGYQDAGKTEAFIVNGYELDLRTQNPTGDTGQSEETTTTPSTEETTPPETTLPETTPPETTVTEPTQPAEPTEPTEPQPTTENTEPTGEPTEETQ